MTAIQKDEIISRVVAILSEMLDRVESEHNEDTVVNSNEKNDFQPVELLTVKECAATISGLSERTVRQLVTQDKIPCVRSKQGRGGKILINKAVLVEYLRNST